MPHAAFLAELGGIGQIRARHLDARRPAGYECVAHALALGAEGPMAPAGLSGGVESAQRAPAQQLRHPRGARAHAAEPTSLALPTSR